MAEPVSAPQPQPGIMIIADQVGLGVIQGADGPSVQLDVYNAVALARMTLPLPQLDQLIDSLGKVRAHAKGEALITPTRGLVGVNGETLLNGRP